MVPWLPYRSVTVTSCRAIELSLASSVRIQSYPRGKLLKRDQSYTASNNERTLDE